MGTLPSVKSVRLRASSPQAVAAAVSCLQRGEVIAFPTDTVYGIGAHALLSQAVDKLYVAKDRSPRLAIPLLLGNAAAMATVCTDIPPEAWTLAERFWPGALSLVLRKAPIVSDAVTGGGLTVAVRVPDHPLILELCRRLGSPLAATSANRHGQPAPVTADEAWTAMAGRVALLLDGGACPGGQPSTVLDLTQSPPAILRAGPVTREQLAAAVGW